MKPTVKLLYEKRQIFYQSKIYNVKHLSVLGDQVMIKRTHPKILRTDQICRSPLGPLSCRAKVTLTLHSGYEMKGACLFWMENACWLGRLPAFEIDTRALRLHFAHVTDMREQSIIYRINSNSFNWDWFNKELVISYMISSRKLKSNQCHGAVALCLLS